MKDGYYLSTYLHIDELAHLTGIRRRHDQNISLWHKNGGQVKLVHFWELERVTGMKKQPISFFDIDHAKEVINKLLKLYKLTVNDMVEIWGTPGLETCNDYSSVIEYPKLSYHSISHLFSAVMIDTEKFYNGTIIGFAVDGGPDGVVDKDEMKKYFYSGCVVRNGEIDIFPVYSPGPLWFYSSLLYNLREGTLMALGSASESQLLKDFDEIILIEDMNSLIKLFDYIKNLKKKVDELTEEDRGILFNGFDPRFSIEDNKISMVMKVIHNMSLKIMEKNVENILEKYDLNTRDTYIALSGGYALNCPTNSYLMEKYKFKGFIAPPCVSDCGLSLGMALYAFKKKMGNFEFRLDSAYYGDMDLSLQEIMDEGKYETYIKDVSDMQFSRVVEDIINAPIVWFDGQAEIGPRALGGRSIIADPRFDVSKDALNIVKQRQWWRPVAPIVLEEEIDEWFENPYSSPFMLHTFDLKKDKLKIVPAITHLDNSARVQTMTCKTNERLYSVIKAFKDKTGVPIICNTSLNDSGEPIINRIEEAINFALRKQIKVAYINGKRVEFYNHDKFLEDKPAKRPINFLRFTEQEKEKMLNKLNPHNVPKEVLQIYYESNLHTEYDLTNINDVRKLTIHAKYLFKNTGVSIISNF